jgi:hypothetical protein
MRSKNSTLTSVPYGRKDKIMARKTVVKKSAINLRRSPGKMPLDAHKKVGHLLKEITAMSSLRTGVHNPVKAVRCILDDWAMEEFPDHTELPNKEFFQIYYMLPHYRYMKHIDSCERSQRVAELREAQGILRKHYPAGATLSFVLKKLDSAIRSMDSWN